MVHELSRADARRIIVRAQLLDSARPGDVVEVAEQLGAIKIDPTSVIAPAEHSILWARIGWSYEATQLTKARDIDHALFEYEGAFRPVSLLPALRARMHESFLHAGARSWLEANTQFRADIVARLREAGPLPSAEIADTSQVAARSESGWYGKTQVPRMLEVMARAGDIAIAGRNGRTRLWDLAERVYGDAVMEPAAAEAELATRRLQAAGLARTKSPWTRVGMAGEEARVESSSWKFRVDPEAIRTLSEPVAPRVALLNPYDPILFDRPRLAEVFDFTYVLEQFKPKQQRKYGYFSYPILLGDRFVGLLDATLDQRECELRVDALHELVELTHTELDAIHAEIEELASWLEVPVRGI